MTSRRAPTQEQAGILIGIAAVIFGGWLRLLIPWLAGFPINDGGLFYVMVRAIQANGLRMPPFVHYNGLDIPFAYPPLGLYAGAAISSLLHVDVIQILQWLPAVVLICTLPAVFFLSQGILGSSFKAGMATLVYAFTPRAITWQIMGGGLTRSFGQLFLILAAGCLYQTFASYDRKKLILSIVFSALAVLSHPEAALQTVGLGILFWIVRGRTKASALHAIVIGAGTLVISSIWWLPLILKAGLTALLSAGQTGLYSGYALLLPLLLNFVEEPMMTLVAVFGLIGFAAEASRGRILLPLWFLIPFLVEPRSAPTTAMVPLALLAGVGLGDVILPALAGFEAGPDKASQGNVLRGRVAPIFLLYVGMYLLGDAAYFGTQLAGSTLKQTDRVAFEWISTNTPADSRFLLLTGNNGSDLFCDAPMEWFPALTGRMSTTTLQGTEWLPSQRFDHVKANAQAVDGCLADESPLACVEGLASSQNRLPSFDFVYVVRNTPEMTACRNVGTSMRGERILTELRQAPGYSQVYGTNDVAIFRRQGAP